MYQFPRQGVGGRLRGTLRQPRLFDPWPAALLPQAECNFDDDSNDDLMWSSSAQELIKKIFYIRLVVIMTTDRLEEACPSGDVESSGSHANAPSFERTEERIIHQELEGSFGNIQGSLTATI